MTCKRSEPEQGIPKDKDKLSTSLRQASELFMQGEFFEKVKILAA
jgi:hypothetical protein